MSKFYDLKAGPAIRISAVTWVGEIIESDYPYFMFSVSGRMFEVKGSLTEVQEERRKLLAACEEG